MRKTRRVPLALNFALDHIVGFARIRWRKRYKFPLYNQLSLICTALPIAAHCSPLQRIAELQCRCVKIDGALSVTIMDLLYCFYGRHI